MQNRRFDTSPSALSIDSIFLPVGRSGEGRQEKVSSLDGTVSDALLPEEGNRGRGIGYRRAEEGSRQAP